MFVVLIIEVYMLLIIIQWSKWKHCLLSVVKLRFLYKISIPRLMELSFQIKLDFLVDNRMLNWENLSTCSVFLARTESFNWPPRRLSLFKSSYKVKSGLPSTCLWQMEVNYYISSRQLIGNCLFVFVVNMCYFFQFSIIFKMLWINYTGKTEST